MLPPSPADAWAHLDAFLAEHVPALAADLAAPASEADIQILADTVGLTTTEPFAALYRFHDGQQSPTPGLFFGLQFLSSAEAAQEWERWAEQLRDDPALVTDIEASAVPEGTVRAVYASDRWVPFASDGAGNHLAIDLDPGPDGTPGQVISFGVDEATRFLLELGGNADDFGDGYLDHAVVVVLGWDGALAKGSHRGEGSEGKDEEITNVLHNDVLVKSFRL